MIHVCSDSFCFLIRLTALAFLLFFVSVLSVVASETAKATEQKSCASLEKDLPVIEGLDYSDARQKLMDEGWIGSKTEPSDTDISNGRDLWEQGFTELEACTGTGLRNCSFIFDDADRNNVRVITSGNRRTTVQFFEFICAGDAILSEAKAAWEVHDDKKAIALFKKAAKYGLAEANFALGYNENLPKEERLYHLSEAAKQGHEWSLKYALDYLIFRAADLRQANPQRALDLYHEAIKENPNINLRTSTIETIEKCVEAGPFDGESFLEQFNLTAEYADRKSYYVWELAESAANSDRFGKPNTKLVLQIICHGGFVPAETELAVADAYDRWKNNKEPHFDICENVTSTIGGYICSWRRDKIIEKKHAKLSYPKVTDHIWVVNGEEILPSCMEVMWASGDNYQEYEKLFPKAKEFNEYPGQYWGSLIPLELIEVGWHIPLSLAMPLKKCNTLQSSHRKEVKKNFIEIIDSKASHREDQNSYRLIAHWGEAECSKLVPHFSGNCKSLVFVQTNENTFYGKKLNTYAHVTHNGRNFIVPVTNNMPLEDVLELLDK